MASQIGTLSIDLEARLAKFESDMGRAARIAAKEMERMRSQVNKQLQAVNDQMSGFANKAGNAFKGLVAALSVRELAQFAKRSIDVADSINDLSKKFGISTQAISTWRLIAEKSGTSLDGISRAAKFLTKDIEKSDFYLKQIGVSMTDLTGKAKPIEQVMSEITTKFAGYEDGVNKAQIATALFGKSGVDLIPFLNDFGENAEEAAARARDFGVAMGPELTAAGDAFNDNMRDMTALTEGFANSVLSGLLPSINSYVEAQIKSAREGQGFVEAGKQVAEILKGIALGFVVTKNAVDLFIGAIKFVVSTVVAQFTAAQQAVGAFSQYMQEAAKAIANPFDENTLEDAKNRFLGKINEIGHTMVDTFKDASQGLGDSIFDNVQDINTAFDSIGASSKTAAGAIGDVGNSAKQSAPKIKSLADAEKDAASASREAKKALSEWAKLQKMHDAEMLKAEEIMLKQARAADEFEASINEVLKAYDEEIQLLGANAKEREELEIILRAEENVRRLLAEATQKGIQLTESEIDAIRSQVKARAEALVVAKKQAEVADEFQRSWESAIDGVNSAFADFITGGLRDFKGFGENLSRIAEGFFSDIISQTLKAGGGIKDIFSNIQSSLDGQGSMLQRGLMAVGSAYSAYQSYRQGNTFGTIAGGAMTGAQIGSMIPGIGTAVGAAVGAIVSGIASLFRSNKPPDIRIGGTSSRVRKPEEQFTTALGGFQIGTRQIDRAPVIQAIQEFDSMVSQMLQAAGVGADQMARIRASLQSVVLDLRGNSATAENVLRSRFDAILGTFDAATQAYVRAGANLQEQVQRLGEHLEFPRQLQELLDQLSEQDRTANMSQLEQQIYALNKQFDEMIERATFLGATQEQLAQIEAYRANALARLNEVEQVERIDEYARAVAELNSEFLQLTSGISPSKLTSALSDIRREESTRIATLNRLARESGRAGAAEQDLVMVHRIAAAKAAQAIAQLRSAAESLVQQLYGNNGINSSPAQDAAASLDATAQDLFQGWESALESIRGFLDSILLDEGLTVLTPQQQLMEAQRQFNNLLSAANSGDAEAAQRLPEIARQLLDNARAFYASGQGYDAIFESVMAGLQGVQGASPGPSTTSGAQQAITQAELAAEDVAQQRMLMAVELAGYIKDLADAMGENVFALTEELGVNLRDFVNDLGVDVTNMTVTTAGQLADIANMLGVELPELAYELGVSLGQLREANSMLNDALEDAINDQPPEIADELRPLLSAVENAVTDADANAALDALNAAVARIGGSTAIALAPYLENVDPPSMEQQLSYLDQLYALNRDYLPEIERWLEEIADSVRDEPVTPPRLVMTESIVPDNMQASMSSVDARIDSRSSSMLQDLGTGQGAVSRSSIDNETKALLRDLVQKINENGQKSCRRDERITSAIEKLASSGVRGR